MTPLVYSLLFFLSGFAGLLYQIVWVHIAFTHFGIITPVLSVVVSVFMLGLGAGSWFAGRGVDRWTRDGRIQALVIYGGVEALTGVWALAVPRLFDLGETILLRGGEMDSLRYLSGSALVLTLALFPACFCMGMTYPVMMSHLRATRRASETTFSFLYLANVMGALVGASLSPFVLIETLGFHRTLAVGVDASLLTAALSLILAQRAPMAALPNTHSGEPASSGSRIWLLPLFVTGFVSMANEVLWTRAFTPVLGTTVYAFAGVVSVYLASTWLGTALYRWDLRRMRMRKLPDLYALLAITALFPVALNDPRWYFGFRIVLSSIVPFCALLGYLTPLLVDRYSRGQSRGAGVAYAVNIAGCVMGPLVASYLMLPFIGPKIAIVALALPLLALVGVSTEVQGSLKRNMALTAAGLIMVGISFFCKSYEEGGRAGSLHPPVIRRDYAATVLCAGEGMQKILLVNGIGITVLTPITKMMAHMPIICHHGKPESALMICFGMGTTYRSLLSWGIKTTAVELVPSVRDSFGYFFSDADAVMHDPNGQIVVDDGRRFLKRTTQRFDIVTLDPPPPVEATGSGLLYSREFYELIKPHLNPHAILQQWWPGGELAILAAVARTLREEFPYVRVFKGLGGAGFHFLASMEPVQVPTFQSALANLPAGVQRDFLEWNPGVALPGLVKPIFGHEISFDELAARSPQDLTDDQPFNEYYLLRRARQRTRDGGVPDIR